MNVKQLQAKVKAAQAVNSKKIEEEAIKATLEATLKLESSKSLFNSKVKLAASGRNTKALQELITECETLVESMPIQNPKTRALRKWSGSRRFAFGTQVNLMYQLATGIVYSCAEHKALLLEHTGLNGELLEQMVEAFGIPSYYSRNHNILVEATPYDVDKAMATVSVMQSSLGVIIDTSLITGSNFSLEFGKAQVTAGIDKLKADEAIEEAELAL